MNFATLAACHATRNFHRFVGAIQNGFGFGEKRCAGLGQLYRALGAIKKLQAEFIFEIMDLPAQRRLRDTKFLRRLGEVQNFSHGGEVSEVSQFHKTNDT